MQDKPKNKDRIPYKELVFAVMQFLGGQMCNHCGSKKTLTIHHTIPVSRGGLHSLGNLEVVCEKCHWALHREWNKLYPLKQEVLSKCPTCGHLRFIKRKIKLSDNCPTCRYRLKYKLNKKLK